MAFLRPLQITVARFMYDTRVATMLFWDAHRLPVSRFALSSTPSGGSPIVV